jgi:hypothetical protein
MQINLLLTEDVEWASKCVILVETWKYRLYCTGMQMVLDISFICDRSVTTQNLAFLSYWYKKKHLQVQCNIYSVITQFAKPAAGEQLCRRCTHRKVEHYKTFKSFSWKITNFELWYSCRKWAIWLSIFISSRKLRYLLWWIVATGMWRCLVDGQRRFRKTCCYILSVKEDGRNMLI